MTWYENLEEVKKSRQFYLDLIDRCFERLKIDIYELGADDLGSDYRNFRPGNCDCYGILHPDDEMEYYISHFNMCCNSWDEINSFYEQFLSLVEKHGERFSEKKAEAIKRIEEKCQQSGIYNSDFYVYVEYANSLLSTTNSYWLEEEEKEIIQEIEEKAKALEEEYKKNHTCFKCKKVCDSVWKRHWIEIEGSEEKFELRDLCDKCYNHWNKERHGELITCPECGKDW